MKPLLVDSLLLVGALAVLSAAVVLCDAIGIFRTALQRRRRNRAGVYGVVVDSRGTVLGTYLDPFAAPTRGARVHDESSPWATPTPEGRKRWAWEGFGATEDEALHAANRLRRRHLQLFPWLGGDGDEEDYLRLPLPDAPNWD
ncbi:MAG TPA: hypothetical protein VFX98_15340 [Longimicrobiaceae bacterium]|nr:hypothetical protein [Longimicrobiaceae bacterium]